MIWVGGGLHGCELYEQCRAIKQPLMCPEQSNIAHTIDFQISILEHFKFWKIKIGFIPHPPSPLIEFKYIGPGKSAGFFCWWTLNNALHIIRS